MEHFLTALHMQQSVDVPQGTRLHMSEAIWSSLRLALMYVDRRDLLEHVQSRNLEFLMKEFNI